MVRINELKKQKKLYYTLLALPVPVVLGLLAFLFGASSTFVISLVAIGLICVVLPSMIISFYEFRSIKSSEDNFPNFLDDLSQSSSAGMNLPQAIKVASKTQYGKLTDHIKQLNIWLTWNMAFPSAWKKFTKRLDKSPLIRRVNGIIIEAFNGGGDVNKTLGSLASDVNIIKDMEAERRSIMQQQIIIMYIIFFVFIGVIIALYKILSPILYVQQIGSFSGIGIQGSGTLSIEYFRNLFFVMTLVEAVCAGLIAGQIAEERLVAGVKHIVIMTASTILIFFLFVFPTTLTVDISAYPSQTFTEGKVTFTGKAFSEGAPVTGADVTIINYDGTPINLFTDNAGEFRYVWNAPEIPGNYTVALTVEHEGEVKSFRRSIFVED